MNNLALLLESQGTFDQAEALYLEPLETLRAQGQATAGSARHGKQSGPLTCCRGPGPGRGAASQTFLIAFLEPSGRPIPIRFGRSIIGAAQRRSSAILALPESLLSALAGREARYGPLHRDVIRSQIDLGSLEQQEGGLAAAEARLRDALSRAERGLGEAHPYTFDALNALAAVLRARGKSDAAFRLQRTGV